jgi:hypothetical protein
MPARLSILFLGVTIGGTAFLEAGFACSLIIAKVQYSTLETRVARAAMAADQISTRAKDAPVIRQAQHVP